MSLGHCNLPSVLYISTIWYMLLCVLSVNDGQLSWLLSSNVIRATFMLGFAE